MPTEATTALSEDHASVMRKIRELYQELFLHDGFGELRVTMRFLKKGQKEVIVICGKEFRFVVDYPEACRQGR